jgi:hypothetical protein
MNRDEAREAVWYFLTRLQALKEEVIVWPGPDEWGDDIWIITVDGTHCWIEEPTHPDWSQDKSFYSHEYNKAGINYELGIAIACSQVDEGTIQGRQERWQNFCGGWAERPPCFH